MSITTSPTSSNSQGGDDVEGLVEHDLLAALEILDLDGRADVDAELAAAGEDVDGVVVVGAEERAEAGRRLGQPVDLFLQRHDLVAGLAQGGGESLVLRGQGREGGLGLGQPLLEEARRLRRVGQPAPQLDDLGLEEADLALELGCSSETGATVHRRAASSLTTSEEGPMS